MPVATTERIAIAATTYIYRCSHHTMEGDCQAHHGPRAVSIGRFQVDRYPVTNARFAEFLEATGYAPAHTGGFLRHWAAGAAVVPPDAAQLPVVWVSPEDAEAFAGWAGGRLPTDEEWQYIAAGPEYRRWPWGGQFDPERCNHDGSALTPVGSYPQGASWCGAEDLAGNAWEWTAPVRDDGMHRFALLRGGSFYNGHDRWHVEGGARPTDFHWKLQLMNPGINRAATVGFRCVYEVRDDQ